MRLCLSKCHLDEPRIIVNETAIILILIDSKPIQAGRETAFRNSVQKHTNESLCTPCPIPANGGIDRR